MRWQPQGDEPPTLFLAVNIIIITFSMKIIINIMRVYCMQCSLRLFQSWRNTSWDLTYSRMMRVRLEMELKMMTPGKKNKTIACPGPGRTKSFRTISCKTQTSSQPLLFQKFLIPVVSKQFNGKITTLYFVKTQVPCCSLSVKFQDILSDKSF